MKTPPMMTKILAVCLLSLATIACSPENEGQKQSDETLIEAQEGPPGSGPLGCCKEGPDTCASPTYKSECTQTDGVFHEGKACHIESGECSNDL